MSHKKAVIIVWIVSSIAGWMTGGFVRRIWRKSPEQQSASTPIPSGVIPCKFSPDKQIYTCSSDGLETAFVTFRCFAGSAQVPCHAHWVLKGDGVVEWRITIANGVN